MKQKKDQEKTEEVIPEKETHLVVPTLPANLPNPLFDLHTLASFKHLNEAVYQPFIDLKDSINSVSEMMRDIIIPVVDFRKNFFEDLVEPIRLAQKGLFQYAEQYQRSATLIASITQSVKVDLTAFNNLVTDFPFADLVKTLDTATILSVDFKTAKITDPQANSVSFEAIASQRTNLGILQFETEQSLVLKVDRLEAKVDTMHSLLADELYPFLLEDSRRKDNILNDLLTYYKGKPTDIAKISDIQFVEKICKLTINGINIPIKINTNEADICRIIFSSKRAINKLWNLDEIVVRLGEVFENAPKWNDFVYQAVRQINTKILVCTGLENFLIYTDKVLCVNPIYLKR